MNTLLQNNKEDINIFNNIKDIINVSKLNITRTVNSEMVNCYWYIGKYIYEAQGSKDRADYGTYLIKYLSERLTKEFGKGFSIENLKQIRRFYEVFSIGHTLCTQSKKHKSKIQKLNTRLIDCPEILKQLSWSHLRLIMRLYTPKKREFYIKECIECN